MSCQACQEVYAETVCSSYICCVRFWFIHSGEVSLRQQLITQVVLGIAGGDLQPNERLPSTRAMAQRYGLHANTVSAAYRELQDQGHVHMRPGSGVYIATRPSLPTLSRSAALQQMLQAFTSNAQQAGYARSDIASAFQDWLATPATSFVLVEPEPALARIVLHELAQANIAATTITFDHPLPADATLLALPSKLARLTQIAPATAQVLGLQIRSVPQSLLAQGAIPHDALIGIASHWPGFLQLAQTMLLATGVPPESLVLRNLQEGTSGLPACAAVLCDALAAEELSHPHRIVFPIVSEESLHALQQQIHAPGGSSAL